LERESVSATSLSHEEEKEIEGEGCRKGEEVKYGRKRKKEEVRTTSRTRGRSPEEGNPKN